MNHQSNNQVIKQAKFYVYELHDDHGQVFYVGSGSGPRYRCHWRPSVQARGGKLYEKIKSMACDGRDFTSHKVSFFDSQAESHAEEIRLIEFYGRDCLCNVTVGGFGTKGRVITDDLRKKFSREKTQAEKDRQSELMRGRTFTLEHRKKISNSLKGRAMSEDAKFKLRQSNIGKKRSDESRAKMSLGQSLRQGREKSFFSACL